MPAVAPRPVRRTPAMPARRLDHGLAPARASVRAMRARPARRRRRRHGLVLERPRRPRPFLTRRAAPAAESAASALCAKLRANAFCDERQDQVGHGSPRDGKGPVRYAGPPGASPTNICRFVHVDADARGSTSGLREPDVERVDARARRRRQAAVEGLHANANVPKPCRITLGKPDARAYGAHPVDRVEVAGQLGERRARLE